MSFYEKLQAVRWYGAVGDLPRASQVEFGFAGLGQSAPTEIHFAKQVHGTVVLRAEHSLKGDTKRRPEADGVMTDVAGTVVAVQTADCLPILFWTPGMVAAVHVGWRGLAKGMITATSDCFKEHGQNLTAMRAVIGPSISADAFEIGWDVVAAIAQGPSPLSPEEEAFCLLKGVGDRWHFDLQAAAAVQLIKKGLPPENLAVVRSCTFAQKNLWHSYRRDKERVGRNWAWIALKKS